MKIEAKIKEEVAEFHFRKYSEAELVALDQKLRQKFWKEKTLSDGNIVRFFDELAFLVHIKALSEKGAVMMRTTGSKDDGGAYYERPCQYEKAQDMLRQWQGWIARKKANEEKIDAEFERLAGKHI